QADHFCHPELYIRARALQLWKEQGSTAEGEIERMIEGGLDLNRLDLLGQKRAAALTRQFLQLVLAPTWNRTEAVLAHARRFFGDFDAGADGADVEAFKAQIERGADSLRDYLCYLLLDFITVDRDLSDVALSAAIVLARRLGMDNRFTEVAQ